MENEERNYTVYMHKNKINGKVYIGITKQKPKYRWHNGEGYNNQVFKKAIDKYGWDNFDHIILFEHLSKEQAEQKEIKLIAKYKSNQKDFGYNISKGGKASNGVPCSEKTKLKISKKNKGTKNGMYGKKHTKESLEKISKASFKKWENVEYRNKVIETLKANKKDWQKGHIPWNKGKHTTICKNMKKVICIETGEIFNSMTEAQKIKKVNNISLCCSGKYKTAGGYHWRYYEE